MRFLRTTPAGFATLVAGTLVWAATSIAAASDLDLMRFNADLGMKLNGSLDRYRYVSIELRQANAAWIVGLDNESNAFSLLGYYQEYRAYAHRYGDYGFLPASGELTWFLGLSVTGSEFVNTAISPDIGFRSRRPLYLWFVPVNYTEDIALYSNAMQCKTALSIGPWTKPLGWPVDIAPTLSHLWFGPLASNTSSVLGAGVQVRVRMND